MHFLRTRGYRFIVAFFVTILWLGIALPAHRVQAAPAEQPGLIVVGGTVAVPTRLNVRDQPAASGRILGKLPNGTRVAIIGRSGNWLLIRFPASPVGLAWVNAAYVAIDGQKPPVPPLPTPATPRRTPAPVVPAAPPPPSVPELPSIQVEPPDLVNFDQSAFRWRWYGDAGQLDNVDWYTDILLFQEGELTPYKTIVAEPGGTGRDGAFLVFAATPFQLLCDTYAVARIAVRQNGNYIGWVSPESNRIKIGPSCSSGGGGSGGSGGGSGGGGGNTGGGGGGNPIDDDRQIDCSNPDWSDSPDCRL